MNIGIDAMGLWQQKTGIGTYVAKIIEELNKIDKKNNYFLYSTSNIVLDFKLNDNFIIKQNIKGKRILWFNFSLPKLLKEDNIDVFWGTQYMLPKKNKYTKNIKFCLTIYDLAIEKFKNIGAFRNTIVQKLFLKKSIKRADEIISISDATKKDIIDLYKIPASKITTTYLGTNFENNKGLITDEQQIRIKEKFKIKNSPYIFFLSTIEPRKNIETLVKAFNYIKQRGKTSLKLVLAGGLGWRYKGILDLINKSEYKEDIIMTGYISSEEKNYLYANAECFVYPSLCEGFGLPILEAMVNEVLVVTANNSSLPEVGGDAAFYYDDVLNYQNLGNKILEVINLNKEEKIKKIEYGINQVKKFTWEKCAKETLKVLE